MSETDTFSLPASLRMDSALAVEAQGLSAIARGVGRFDLSALADLDSSAVAVLLSWRRAAAAHGLALEYIGAAPSLLQLAELYGVTELAFGAAAGAAELARHRP